MLLSFDNAVAEWTSRVDTLGSSINLLTIIMEAIQVLCAKAIPKKLINAAA